MSDVTFSSVRGSKYYGTGTALMPNALPSVPNPHRHCPHGESPPALPSCRILRVVHDPNRVELRNDHNVPNETRQRLFHTYRFVVGVTKYAYTVWISMNGFQSSYNIQKHTSN